MPNTLRIKRRGSGSAGAPSTLENAELAFNEVDNTLYYGEGTGGAGGSASTVLAIAGDGAFVNKTGTQTGLIAQEAEAVLPSTVVTATTGVKTLHTDDIFWHMLNAIKELSTKVKALEAG